MTPTTNDQDPNPAIDENLELLARLPSAGVTPAPVVTQHRPRTIERAIARLVGRRRDVGLSHDLETMSPAAFRAVVAQRLSVLERECTEMRARLNGLIFVTVGAVLASLVERLVG